ncbi:MAG: extracellular solute-binding protein [Oscillospiraceae bacterium]|nr:extracellular solute-binding protein [Oscillospiraceae bacterium]
MKKALSILLILALICVPLVACADTDTPSGTPPAGGGDTPPAGGGDDTPPAGGGDTPPAGGGDTVTLTLWGGEEDQAMLRERADAFIAAHADEATIVINIGVESESTAKDTILTDPQAAADVFTFADDQIMELYMAGALQPVLLNTDDIKARNVASSVSAASVDGTLVAYPLTADNGYFMFYDKSYFEPSDLESFDRMMEIAADAGKFIAMELQGGWYNIAFFRGAGFDAWLAPDGVSTLTNINEAGGTDVLQGMLDISKNPGFASLGNDEFVTGINDGSVIAGVNGPWNSNNAREAWGDNYGATKLPTFTVDGRQVQMGGVVGHKLIGVNQFSAEAGWAMRLADWLTNYDSQVIRFELRGQGPSNIQAASSPAVQADPALVALSLQAQYSAFFGPGGNYWSSMETLGEIVRQGNPDNIPLQEILDNAVAGITA